MSCTATTGGRRKPPGLRHYAEPTRSPGALAESGAGRAGGGPIRTGPLRLRTTVDRVLRRDDYVEATLIDQATGTSGSIRARFLVACDGAASRSAGAAASTRRPGTAPGSSVTSSSAPPGLREQLGDRAALVPLPRTVADPALPVAFAGRAAICTPMVVGADEDTPAGGAAAPPRAG
ncbi:FAD-dependent monooxygenase [Streptomyces clavuligerus]|uniref:FAD-dependent monooxygenase n=1 Tax=Streptomyces clavuligerus TaxID=1901 RepID=UPI0023DE0AE2|nr:FAD-dependent monooxygenase [Streptomyces clavuligerus]